MGTALAQRPPAAAKRQGCLVLCSSAGMFFTLFKRPRKDSFDSIDTLRGSGPRTPEKSLPR